MIETVFRIHTELCEYDEAIEYFNGNNMERDMEVSLYALLSLLLEYNLKELWLREYDEALKKGVEPREALRKTHQYILENDMLTEHFLH